MASRSDTQIARVKRWFERITVAEKVRDAWEQKFQPQKLERYWEGFQWGSEPIEDSLKKYVINLVYGTMESEKPSLMFTQPRVKVSPRPTKADDNLSTMREQAQLCQDTIQTFIDRPETRFREETDLALQESYFRYGVVEIGYSADWIDNPNADQPVLKGDSNDPLMENPDNPVKQPKRIPADGSETLYVKRIPAKNFLVSVSSKNGVQQNDWVAYSEWHYVEDIKANAEYQNTAELRPTGVLDEKLRGGEVLSAEEMERRHGMVRIWKVWDLRTKKRYVLAEGHRKMLLDGIPYTVFPFAVLKFHERLDDFYPLPPIFNWKGPQDELNETREMQRVHRRRFIRRYLYRKGSIDTTELEKLETGEDGVYAEHNGAPGEDPLKPVPDAPLDGAVWNQLAAVKEDFTQVSGTPSELRGVPQSSTATQANIMNTRTQIRESSKRTQVADWLASIARIMLDTLREKMSLPFWIQTNVDLTGMGKQEEIIETTVLWAQIVADQLGTADFEVKIDLASLSPVTQEARKGSWVEMLMTITNPAVVRYLAISPYMLRQSLVLMGITNKTDQNEIAQAIEMGFMQEQMAQMAAGGSTPGGKGRPSDAAPVQPQAGVPTGAAGME